MNLTLANINDALKALRNSTGTPPPGSARCPLWLSLDTSEEFRAAITAAGYHYTLGPHDVLYHPHGCHCSIKE